MSAPAATTHRAVPATGLHHGCPKDTQRKPLCERTRSLQHARALREQPAEPSDVVACVHQWWSEHHRPCPMDGSRCTALASCYGQPARHLGVQPEPQPVRARQGTIPAVDENDTHARPFVTGIA